MFAYERLSDAMSRLVGRYWNDVLVFVVVDAWGVDGRL